MFENSKIKSLRLYFDRLDFSGAVAKDVISKTIIKEIVNKSLEGLRQFLIKNCKKRYSRSPIWLVSEQTFNVRMVSNHTAYPACFNR